MRNNGQNRGLKGVLALLLFGFISASPALAHDEDVVGGGSGLSNLIGGLYGGNGITLDVPATPGVPSHAAHFTASSQNALNNLGNTISSNLGAFSFNSSASGVSFDLESGEAVRTKDSLGPILAERATTIGRDKVSLGVSYSYIEYKQLDGVDLKDLKLDLQHVDLPGVFEFEKDIVRLSIDLELKQQVFAFYANYGVTDNLDVGLVVPIVQVDGSARSVATVIPTSDATVGIHKFGIVSPLSYNSGSATGLGDIVARAKWNFSKGKDLPVDAALFGQLTLPTGDEDDLLGAGSTALYVGGVASKTLGRLTPHLNLGYEHYFDEGNSTFDRSNTRMVAGVDFKASDRLAFSTDIVGRWETEGSNTIDLAIGAKWEVKENLPISLDFIVPMNRDEGLRPDYVISVGIEKTF